jgi:inorganic pyrophosphatase
MTRSIEQLPAFDEKQSAVHVIIETSKGGGVKYSYKPKTGMFYAKRLLPPGMVFPFNFGFIPSTLGEDGDPVDMLILNDVPLVCGCLVKATLVAVINAEQTENGKTFRNDRLVGALADEESPAEFLKMELDARRVAEVQFFFATYNQFSGKQFKVLGTGDSEEARRLVLVGEKRFSREKAQGAQEANRSDRRSRYRQEASH